MTVKALIWSHRNDQPAYEVCADCPFGRYAISPDGEHGYGWKQPRQNVWAGFVPTCEEAKAAAQADYEARILSAIEPAHSRSYEPEFPTDGFPDNEPPKVVLRYVLDCVQKWAKDARIIGNARAGDIEIALFSTLTNTSGDDEDPVAWRYRHKEWSEDFWNYFTKEPRYKEDDEIWQGLYTRPQSAAVRDDVSELLMAIENAARMAEQGVLSVDGGQAAVEIRSLVPIRFRAVPQSAAVRDGWQPIEAAPRSNGSDRFLAFIPGHGACVCACTVLGNVYSVSSNRTVHKATHWMPLPAAPALHSTQEG